MYNEGRKEAALRYIDSVFSNKKIPLITQVRIYHFKNWFCYYSSNYECSNLYIDSMLYVLEHYKIGKKYPSEYVHALNAKGDYYFSHNDWNKAFDYYYRGKIAAEDIKDTCAFGNHAYHLGMVTFKQKNYEDAIDYFKLSYEQNKSCITDSLSFYRSQELYSNIGLCYTLMKKADSAIFYYGKALDYIALHRIRFGPVINDFAEVARAVIYGNMAKIFIQKGAYDTARSLLLESIEINEQPTHDNRDALFAKLDLAELYGKMQEYQLMSDVLKRVKIGVDTMPGIQQSKIDLEWRFFTYKYYVFTKQQDKALAMINSFMELRDSMDVDNKKLDQTNVSQLLQSQETRYQNELLLKNQQVSKLYLTITIGLAAMIMVIGVLIYVNYRRSRRNVEELTALNKQVNEQKMALQQTVNQKDTILRVVAHDLRDPIGGISFLSRNVFERESDESLKQSLSIIHHTSENSLSLINELLELSGTPTTGPAAAKSICDANEIILQAVITLEFKASEKVQKLEMTPWHTPALINVNTEKIFRAVCNILSNAIKFSRRNTAIYIAAVATNEHVIISIMDSGMGISLKMQPFIFDQFSAAKRQGTSGEKSYGLGLSISKQLVEAEGGKLWFESEEGKGSTFFMQFPIAKQAPEG